MYQFIDRPVTSLDPGGRFLVWAMRSWVTAMAARTCPANALAGAFAKGKMIWGLQPFLRMMAQFNRHGLENFQFCALPCNHVSEHEAIIVSLVCALRDERPERVTDTLARLVEEECIGDQLTAICALARSLDAAGLYPAPPVAPPESVSRPSHG
jgi:hypothetical protein